MKIENHVYVRFSYTFTDHDGKEVYATEENNPPWYIHGHGLLMPALENALVDHQDGDEFTVELKPADAFGERLEELVHSVEASSLPEGFKPEIGAMLQGEDQAGNTMPIVVVGVEGDKVILDANHPLAGRELTCSMKVLQVREANSREKGEVAKFLGNKDGMATSVDEDGSIIMEFGSDDEEPVSKGNFNVASGGCSGCGGGCSPSNGNKNDGGCSDPGSCCS